MSQDIMLRIPDELYRALEESAEKQGTSPTDLILAVLAEVVRGEVIMHESGSAPGRYIEGYDPSADPLAPFIGIFDSGAPGGADRHDEAFGAIGDRDVEQ